MSELLPMRLPGSWGGKGKVHAVRTESDTHALCGRSTRGLFLDEGAFDSWPLFLVCIKCKQRAVAE